MQQLIAAYQEYIKLGIKQQIDIKCLAHAQDIGRSLFCD